MRKLIENIESKGTEGQQEGSIPLGGTCRIMNYLPYLTPSFTAQSALLQYSPFGGCFNTSCLRILWVITWMVPEGIILKFPHNPSQIGHQQWASPIRAIIKNSKSHSVGGIWSTDFIGSTGVLKGNWAVHTLPPPHARLFFSHIKRRWVISARPDYIYLILGPDGSELCPDI